MTNNSPLDKHIKEKFGDYSPDVPAHIWENIIAERNKRKPAGFWFSLLNKNMLFLFLGIVIAGAGVLVYKNVSAPDTKNEGIAITGQGNSIDKTNNNNIAPVITAEKNTSATNENTTSANKITGPGNSTPTAAKDLITGNEQANVPAKNNLSTIRANKNNNTFYLSDGNSSNTASGNNNKRSKKTKGSAVMSFKNAVAETDDIATDDAKENNDLLLNRLLLNLDMIRSQKTFNASVKQTNNPHLDIPCPEAEKDAAGNKRYFEIYAGPDYAFRRITDTGNSAYLQKRKESVSFSSAFSAGLRYTKVFGNGMSFRTGINYSQINEKFKFAQGNIIQLVYVTNSNGDTTGSYTTTSIRYKTTFNKFRTIDVPIMVGYEMGNGRWHINYNAGAIVNLYSWQKGDVLDTAYQPISITTGKSSSPYQFKTNVGIGFMGAVSVYYKLTDRLHLLAEPYFRYNFSPASKSELTLKQKYNTAGLRIGIRMDF